MLYWICPECGGECSPAIRECPACAGTRAISPASVGPAHRKPAVTEQVLALVQQLQPTPQPPARGFSGGNGHSAPTATIELPELPLPPAPPVREERSIPPQEAIEALVRPLIESTTLAPPPPPEPLAKPEPLAPQVLSDALALQAELILDSIPQPGDSTERSAIRGIVASFQQPSKTGLLAPPVEVITAPAPPSLQWMRIPRPRILPVPPKNLNPSDLMAGLQTPPLAGPTVPSEVRNLTEQHGVARSKARRKATLPAWTVSFLVALILFLGVGSVLQYLAGSHDASAAPPSSQPSDPTGSVVQSGDQSSKLVEVTGLRVAIGPNRRPQLEFIVVNHSATQLSDVGLRIAVRSASSSTGVAPLFRVSTTIASLGPYQSREFRAELDPEVHATDIPDWQSLRADVHITQ